MRDRDRSCRGKDQREEQKETKGERKDKVLVEYGYSRGYCKRKREKAKKNKKQEVEKEEEEQKREQRNFPFSKSMYFERLTFLLNLKNKAR